MELMTRHGIFSEFITSSPSTPPISSSSDSFENRMSGSAVTDKSKTLPTDNDKAAGIRKVCDEDVSGEELHGTIELEL